MSITLILEGKAPDTKFGRGPGDNHRVIVNVDVAGLGVRFPSCGAAADEEAYRTQGRSLLSYGRQSLRQGW